MQKWQYHIFSAQAGGWLGGAVNLPEIAEALTRLGDQGWELASTFDTAFSVGGGGAGGTRDIVLIFKRPIERP